MAELLLELLSEEIPARMQAGAARDLARMVGERFAAAGLACGDLRAFAGPRRLTLVADGVPAATPDRSEELKGPKASAPPQAVEGFLRKTGLTRDQLVERDGVLYATLSAEGRPAPKVAAEAVGEVMRAFPWPKSMTSATSSFRWVRPLRSVLFLFDGAVVPFTIDGIASGAETRGHRFLGSRGAPFAVTGFDDYRARLGREFVVLDAADRRSRILEGARAACAAEGLELVEDEGLLDEVAGLAELPTPVLGRMDPAFLDLPPEVIRTSMRTHQKYFAVRRPGETGLSPHFVVVANVEASDGGRALAAGNARVLSARLNDARFFWDEDRKPGAFERWLGKLEGVTFHAKLGSMAERVSRIEALAREIAPLVHADPELAARAARLAKADLASAMVGEFPELQGIMGGYYARLAGEPDAVADAVRDHYKPAGPSDAVPTAPVTVAVALADKLDTLVGFFAIDEKPTGSKDPYALRRAALGVIRLVLGSEVRLPLMQVPWEHFQRVVAEGASRIQKGRVDQVTKLALQGLPPKQAVELGIVAAGQQQDVQRNMVLKQDRLRDVYFEVLDFFADRLKVQLRDEGRRHDLVDAVFALGDDDLVRIVARVEALSAFLATEDGATLLAGYKRAVNILRAEEKKGAPLPLDGGEVGSGGEGAAVGRQDSGRRAATPIPGPSPIEGEGRPAEEAALRAALAQVQAELEPLLVREDFAGAMASLARLRAPVDAFFDRVLVNDPDPEVRLDRLRLLQEIRAAANKVADFSLIAG